MQSELCYDNNNNNNQHLYGAFCQRIQSAVACYYYGVRKIVTVILLHLGGGGWGVLRFELDRGVLLEPQNPYPSLRVILAKKVPIFKDIPSKIGLFFKNFAIFRVFVMRKPRKSCNLGLSQKSWPMFKDFFG